MMKSNHVAVIGAGLLGQGIAEIFAARGNEVFLFDMDREVLTRAVDRIRRSLSFLAENGVGDREEIPPTLERIRAVRSLVEAVSGARFVVECVAEELEVKRGLLVEMEKHCSSMTVLATNSATLSITEIAAKCKTRERVVGTHFFDPPRLIPLVEVIKGRHTSDEVIDYTCQLLGSIGKKPVRVKKDAPGSIGDRLQHALLREAISIVEQGIADPEAVDEVVKSGLGLILPVLGPLQNADMAGLDLILQSHEYILPHMERSGKPSTLLSEKNRARELGLKTGEGFYKWSPQYIEECQELLIEHLLRWNREHARDAAGRNRDLTANDKQFPAAVGRNV